MPQEFSYLAQRGSSVQHACSQRMAKLMRTLSRRINPGSAKSTFDDIPHRHARESHCRRFGPEKYSPAAG
jgi:hypothetical protein